MQIIQMRMWTWVEREHYLTAGLASDQIIININSVCIGQKRWHLPSFDFLLPIDKQISSKARGPCTCFWLAAFPAHERRKENPQVGLSFHGYSSAILPWWAPVVDFCFSLCVSSMLNTLPVLIEVFLSGLVATAFNSADSGSRVFLDCLATFPVAFVLGIALFFMCDQTVGKVWWG